MSQLTVWLNQYYPGVPFARPTFETWNPLRPPEHAQKQVYFQRAVHTADTPRVLAAIEAEQGKDGIYYAGAYCVYGMGLLEQAAVSGAAAARRVLKDLDLTAPDVHTAGTKNGAQERRRQLNGAHAAADTATLDASPNGTNHSPRGRSVLVGHGHGADQPHGDVVADKKRAHNGNRNGAHNGLAAVNLQQ
eukprot:scaffold119927_cov60-Phaeocystis_antarctica.AAC.1